VHTTLGIFISTSLYVSGNYVPIIRSTYCISVTLVFFTLYLLLSGLLVEMRLVSSQPLLLSIFISTFLHVSDNSVSIIRRTYCIYATLVFFTLHGWLSGLQTRQPPIQSEKYQCHIDTVSSSDDGHRVARNMQRS